MGLGLEYGSGGGGGDIVPFVKYDARAGRFFRNDRSESGGQYSFKLVKLGQPMPAKPSEDGKWKQGVRVMMKLHASCGGDIRETSSNAAAFLKGIDELHTAYEGARASQAGKLPIVTLKTTIPVTSGSGDKKSTNYQPVFEIVGWAPRPNDLVHVAKQGSAPAGGTPAQQPVNQLVPSGPPATGSTQVSAPAAKQAEMADANGFG
jgi:hypothetical protein